MSTKPKTKDGSMRIVLHTSAINSYGFRMLTQGADLKRFYKNPIMLAYHERGGKKWQTEPSHPIGIWKDIKLEGDTISALPSFYIENDYAMEIYAMYEAGILRMASMGARPIEESTEPQYLLPGQSRATVIKWEAIEASITDIGSNPDALTINDARIELSEDNIDTYLPKILNTNKMTIKLSAAVIMALALGDNFTETDINDAVVKLNADFEAEKQAKAKLADELKTANDAKAELELKLSTQKIDVLLSAAKNAGKITEKQVPFYKELAASNFETTEKLLNDIPAREPIADQLNTGASSEDPLLKLSWDQLDKSGRLEELKEKHPAVFAQKEAEAFPTLKK